MKLDLERVATALLTTRTVKEAADLCGVSDTQIYRIKQRTDFSNILRNKRREITSDVNNRAIAYLERGLTILIDLAEDKSEQTNSRLAALKQIFTIGESAVQEELEERLTAIEEQCYAKNHR